MPLLEEGIFLGCEKINVLWSYEILTNVIMGIELLPIKT